MPLFSEKPIIVPWDFSANSEDALAQAVDLAGSPEQIEVIHVTRYPSAEQPMIVWETFSEDTIREKLEQSFLEQVPAEKYPGIKFIATFGDPGSEIAERAKEIGAGLIVISSHGRTGVAHFLLGSVAERVVRLSPCPVLVLRDDHK